MTTTTASGGRPRRHWRRLGVALALMLTVLAGVAVAWGLTPKDAAAAGVGEPVSRSEVIARAESWVNKGYEYTYTGGTAPDPDGKPYRRDCSGYVSMAWHLDRSRVVSTDPSNALVDPNLSHKIGKDELKAGDALVVWDTHVRLFHHWVDDAHTRYVAYDFGAFPVKHKEYLWNGAGDYQNYQPYRYNNIVDDGSQAPPAAQQPTQPDQPAKYWVNTFQAGPGRAEPSRNAAEVGILNAGRNYVWCKKAGGTVTGDEGHNRLWLWTDLDSGAKQGWVSAYYLSDWGNDEARDLSGAEIPTCT